MRQSWQCTEDDIKELIAKDWNEKHSEATGQVLTKEDIRWEILQPEQGPNTIRFVFETFE